VWTFDSLGPAFVAMAQIDARDLSGDDDLLARARRITEGLGLSC
jgi:hypothetical protein